MTLSILVCTISSRTEKLEKLIDVLSPEESRDMSILANDTDEGDRYFIWKYWHNNYEILVYSDNKEISVGLKRQRLLESATCNYIVFVDDDDTVKSDYIKKILQTIWKSPVDNHKYNNLKILDSIGFKIECDMEGKKELAIASNKYSDWCENKDGFRYCRTPYHKTPIKREIALQIGYKDMRFGEDYDYSKRLKESGLIKNEVFIDEVMYYYNYKYENPKTKYGIQD